MRDLIVIPRDGEKSNKFLRQRIEYGQKYVDRLNQYVKDFELAIEEEKSMYFQGMQMALEGYCVVEIEDLSFRTYVPYELTEEQYKWYLDNKKDINSLLVTATLVVKESGQFTFREIKKESNNRNPIDLMFNALERNVVCKEAELDDVQRSSRIRK